MKVIVEAFEKGLKFRNGRFVGVLEPGRHRAWRIFVKERIDRVDLRAQTLAIQGQEMMTADKVTLRLNVVAGFRIADPVAATMKVWRKTGTNFIAVESSPTTPERLPWRQYKPGEVILPFLARVEYGWAQEGGVGGGGHVWFLCLFGLSLRLGTSTLWST